MRYLTDDVVQSLVEDRKMAFVAGPRQVGKTTLARSLLASPVGYFNWDVETDRRRLLRSPEDFWRDALSSGGAEAGAGSRPRIVLDEIHKFPRWKRFLKGLFDGRGPELEVIVTGSGRLDVYQRGGDSLFGRYALHRLHPFSVGELLTDGSSQTPSPEDLLARLEQADAHVGAAEALDRIERFSGFPEPLFAGSATRFTKWRRSRRELVLKEDLRDLTRIRELGFIDALSLLLPDRIGSPLSVNALREDLGVAYNSVRLWLDVLARLYYLFEIRPFAGRLTRTLRHEAKAYLFDPTEISSPGARFENLVALHLLKLRDVWNDRGQGDFELHYVRDKEKREVDFLLTDHRKPFLLVETKLTEDAAPSLRYFAERLKPRLSLLVVRAGEVRRRADGSTMPADRFLALI